MAKRRKERRSTAAPQSRRSAAGRPRRPRRSKPKTTDAALLARELEEARQQQAATADVLKVISRSPTHIQPVFDTIVENVVQLGDGVSAFVYRYDGDLIHLVAHDKRVTPEALQVFNAVYPLKPSRTSVIAQTILDRTIVHVRDFESDPGVAQANASRDM